MYRLFIRQPGGGAERRSAVSYTRETADIGYFRNFSTGRLVYNQPVIYRKLGDMIYGRKKSSRPEGHR